MARNVKPVPQIATDDQVGRSKILASKLTFDESRYEYDTRFVPADISNPFDIHTTAEMVKCLELNKRVSLDARVIGRKGERVALASIGRERFIESFKKGLYKLREADPFSFDDVGDISRVGEDFMPYLGGPFYKNLYYYQDYLRMHSACFWAANHDPIAKAIIDITVNFTLGRGFRVDCEDTKALALWKAFEKANDLPNLMKYIAREHCVYGETMLWWLPNNETAITYQLDKDDVPPIGLIPRIRTVDPSNIIEIVTYPEDITRQLFYVWLAPTQYQIYTGSVKTEDPAKPLQPSLKFIYRHIPAEQMMHFRENCVSNEKRGRSDFFPALGFMKRLRDSVNYSLVSLQKQAAWSIDTSIDGSRRDIDDYYNDQVSQGSIQPAGSEFVHSKKVERKFLSSEAGRSGQHEIFEWCMSMIAAASGIPVSYFGSHMSGGQTRASALVATEPVAKKFEMRQMVYENMIRSMWDKVMEWGGMDAECNVTFPDLISQDRSAKLKDLALCETQSWFTKGRCAEIAAKEMDITEFDYTTEQEELKTQPQPAATSPKASPLTAPSMLDNIPNPTKPSAVTGTEKKEIKQNDRS